MMRYEDHFDSKTIRNIIKEELPEAVPADATFIANDQIREKKMLIATEREKCEKLKTLIILC